MSGRHRGKIDHRLSRQLIDRLRTPSSHAPKYLFPDANHPNMIECRDTVSLAVPYDRLQHAMAEYCIGAHDEPIRASIAQSMFIGAEQNQSAKNAGSDIRILDDAQLSAIGRWIIPHVAFGVLNGGSATSYFDHHRNKAFSSHLFKHFMKPFARAETRYGNMPKGVIPALYNSDGSPGPTFMELKMRSLNRWYHSLLTAGVPFPHGPHIPLFQMTSESTDAVIRRETRRLRKSFMHSRVSEWVRPFPHWHTSLTMRQGLIPTFSDMPSTGRPHRFFYQHNGRKRSLGLPAGHGQNFYVLRSIYKTLAKRGYRFVTLGNIDNIAYRIEPALIAHVALSDVDGAFYFMPRSAVDIKGGVLMTTKSNTLQVVELGTNVALDDIQRYEESGGEVFFNAAVGIFNLERLIKRLDYIIEQLPVYLFSKESDGGAYMHIEQLTWDVIPLLEKSNALILPKRRSLLAAKLLLESYLTSGLPLPSRSEHAALGASLFDGVRDIIAESAGIEYYEGFWL